MSIGGALLRKAFADVTRRKTRTLGVILGIVIGVFGLTAITMFQDTYFAALAYTNAEVKQADITFDVQAVDPALAPRLLAVPNVQTAEFHTISQTSWHIQRAPGRIFLVIVGLPNPTHIDINAFQLLSGHYPGPGKSCWRAEIVAFNHLPWMMRLRWIRHMAVPNSAWLGSHAHEEAEIRPRKAARWRI